MKITLIALHYGDEGSGGARRSYLWAKGLRAAGHEVYVVSPYVESNHPYNIQVPFGNREAASRNLPAENLGFIEKYLKPHARIWLRWPDPEISWHRKIIDDAIQTIGASDWLITSSPPESAHRIGGPLAKTLGAKWCAELRDSWIENSHRHYIRGLRGYIEKRFAKRWLRNVDVVTSVNTEVLDEARKLAPQAASLEIGHFSEAFVGTPFSLPKDSFNLVHAGGFKRSDRRRSLSYLLKQLAPIFDSRHNFHLHLIGPLTAEETEILQRTTLPITHHGWVSLSKSRAIQAGADACLLYTPASGSSALPGKYSEYCNLRKPIFFLGSDTIKNLAHRKDEFLPLDKLMDYPKGQQTKFETEATVERAVEDLLTLLHSLE